MNEQCNVDFQIGTYKDVVLCNIIPMDVRHVLLGSPWKYDIQVIHDVSKNTYSLENDGKKHTLLHMKDEVAQEDSGSNILLMTSN